jgi:hypothetical protein
MADFRTLNVAAVDSRRAFFPTSDLCLLGSRQEVIS